MATVNDNTLPAAKWIVHGAVLSAGSAKSTGTSNTQSAPLAGVERYSSATVQLNITALAGTSVNVWIQKLLPDNSTWMDIISFTQQTGTGDTVMEIVAAGNAEHTPADGGLAAGTVLTANLGQKWAVSWSATGGTATFGVFADFFE